MPKFNAFTYAESLKQAGVSEQQARVHAEGFMTLVEELASKEDLKHLEEKMNDKINMVETVLSAKITSVDTKLNWLMTLVGGFGVLLALLNFLHWYCSK